MCRIEYSSVTKVTGMLHEVKCYHIHYRCATYSTVVSHKLQVALGTAVY